MIFEFLIAYRQTQAVSIKQILSDLLYNALTANMNDIDEELLDGMIRFQHARYVCDTTNDNGELSRQDLLGFSLNISDDTDQLQAVVDDFSAALSETSPIYHAVRFEDPLLHADLVSRAEEIFALEMKLRRVLTLIYLNANKDGDPYDLLKNESVQPMNKEKPSTTQMKAASENQFFHLTFGQYVGLNKRPDFRLPDLLSVVRDSASYDAFREEINRAPVDHEDDAVLLSGLKDRMDAIETMRNCVAHNRRPSKRAIENYDNARPLLDQMLEDYLARWLPTEEEEMIWDTEARKAVEEALENAEWNEEAKTITLFDRDDDRMRSTVKNRDELEDHLRELAASAFYSYAPRDSGEFVFECDEEGVVASALEPYEDRLNSFFIEV